MIRQIIEVVNTLMGFWCLGIGHKAGRAQGSGDKGKSRPAPVKRRPTCNLDTWGTPKSSSPLTSGPPATIPPTAGESSLIPNLIPPLRPQFTYNFIADISGTMDIRYTVTQSGTALNQVTGLFATDCFGLQGFFVDASGGQGGPEGTVGPGNNTCGTTSGDLVGPI